MRQAHFSPKQLHGQNTAAMQDMLHAKGINWNDCPIPQKRGVCLIREVTTYYDAEEPYTRSRWTVDEAIPIFTENRDYVDRFVTVESIVLSASGNLRDTQEKPR